MSVREMISAALQNPDLFWAALGALAQAIEALVVLVSAVVVIFQLKRMRQESVRDRVGGLNTALRILDSTVFRKLLRGIAEGAEIRGINWQEVFEQLDLIALLIEEGYTDEKMFLRLKREELHTIAEYVAERVTLLKYLQEHKGAQLLLEKVRNIVGEGA